jgi:hypothetical protein
VATWHTADGRWEVEPISLNGRPCYRVMGPGMRGPEYVYSLAEVERRMGDAFGELVDPDDDGE